VNLIEIKRIVNTVLDKLYNENASLFVDDVNEDTINSLLANYLEGMFPSYNIDVEYNREHIPPYNESNTKHTITIDGEIRIIKPDIIVHKRNTIISNLLVIQCKKQWKKDKKYMEERQKDYEILCEMTMTVAQAKKQGIFQKAENVLKKNNSSKRKSIKHNLFSKRVFAYKYGLFIDYGKARKDTIVKRIVNGTLELRKI
jgi:hypothetical protein